MKAPKATQDDAQLGKVLWIRRQGDWVAIVVDRVVASVKGPKVYYHEYYEPKQQGECLLRDCYLARHA